MRVNRLILSRNSRSILAPCGPLSCHRVSLVCVKGVLPPLAKAIKKRRRSGRRSGEPRAGGSQMVTQFSRNIRAKISTAARSLRPSALRSPSPHSLPPPKETTFGFGGLTWPCKRGEEEEAAAGGRAGTPSMTICWLQAPIVNSH